MESFIEFLGQYWDLAIAGGVTLGTLITALVAIIRFAISIKRSTAITATLTAELKHSAEERKQLIAEREVHMLVLNSVFQQLSYLTASSKLSTADKLVLQENLIKVRDVVAQVYPDGTVTKPAPVSDKEQEPIKVIENKPEFIKTAADVAVSLIEKYTKE